MRNRLIPQPVLKPGEVEIEGLYMPDRIYPDVMELEFTRLADG